LLDFLNPLTKLLLRMSSIDTIRERMFSVPAFGYIDSEQIVFPEKRSMIEIIHAEMCHIFTYDYHYPDYQASEHLSEIPPWSPVLFDVVDSVEREIWQIDRDGIIHTPMIYGLTLDPEFYNLIDILRDICGLQVNSLNDPLLPEHIESLMFEIIKHQEAGEQEEPVNNIPSQEDTMISHINNIEPRELFLDQEYQDNYIDLSREGLSIVESIMENKGKMDENSYMKLCNVFKRIYENR